MKSHNTITCFFTLQIIVHCFQIIHGSIVLDQLRQLEYDPQHSAILNLRPTSIACRICREKTPVWSMTKPPGHIWKLPQTSANMLHSNSHLLS